MLGLETAHSPNAEDITTIHSVMVVVAVALAVAVNLALLFCIVRFRAARGREPIRFRGRGKTQARVAAVFAVLAAAIFVAGVSYARKARDTDAAEPLKIRAVGQQWIWRYEYPAPASTTGAGGAAPPETAAATTSTQSFADVFSYYELVVPVNTAVEVDIDSTDVVHRWWVPELGGKFDAAPGHLGRTWFEADQEGVYDGQSAAFSGASYAAMRTRVRVVSQAEYETWVTKQAADIQAAQASVQKQLATGGPPQ